MPKVLLDRHPHPKYPRLTVQLRANSKFYQAVTYLDGKMRQVSTKTTHLPTAFKLAEDWYKRQIRASVAIGRQHPIEHLTTDPTMAELYGSYSAELGKPQQAYASMKWGPIADFWRARTLSTVSTSTFKDFYSWRRRGKTIKNHTLHKDVVLVRQILKYALGSELLKQLPYIPPVGKIEANPRPWFTPTEWSHLIQVANERIKNAPNQHTRQQRHDVFDFIWFLYATMLRVGELRTLRFHSCRMEKNPSGDKLLLCEVTGKRGTRTVVGTGMAALIYERRLKNAKAADLMFPHHCRDGFRELLVEAGLREHEGFARNLKSVRATSISTSLLQNPELNLTVVARNAGTSIQMIDDFYAKRLTAEMHKDVLSTMPPELSAAVKVVESKQQEAEQRRVDLEMHTLMLDKMSPLARAAMLEAAGERYVKDAKYRAYINKQFGWSDENNPMEHAVQKRVPKKPSRRLRAPRHRDHLFHAIVITHSTAS